MKETPLGPLESWQKCLRENSQEWAASAGQLEVADVPLPILSLPLLTRGMSQGSGEPVICGDPGGGIPMPLPYPWLDNSFSPPVRLFWPWISSHPIRNQSFPSLVQVFPEQKMILCQENGAACFTNPALPNPGCPEDAHESSLAWQVKKHWWERVSAGTEKP